MKNLVKFSLSALMISVLTACSGSDGSTSSTTESNKVNTAGTVNGGAATNGATNSGNTAGGAAANGATNSGNTAGGATTNGATNSGNTAGGAAANGATNSGNTAGGAAANGATNSGNTTGGAANNGTTADVTSESVYGGSSFSTVNGEGVGKVPNSFLKESNSYTLVIDDKVITPSKMKSYKTIDFDNNQFGWYINPAYKDGNDDGTFYYSLGKLTTKDSVPTTGTFSYSGKAVHGTSETGNTEALSSATVNFDQKTVNVRIFNTEGSINHVLPEATISANQFSAEKNNTYVRGNFYGANAEEIGGTYYNNKDEVGGVFGATKK